MVMVAQETVERRAADADVPLAQPFVNGREIELVSEVIRSGRLSLGPMLTRFEKSFARFLGVRNAVAVSSGTAGLHVAALTSGWTAGDEVITSPFSFVASANVIRYTGATVKFADIDANTLNLDPAAVEAAVGPHTRGILPVHIFGYPAAMKQISDIARRHNLNMVEDACEALGASYSDGRLVGTTGNPAVFAFYPNKQMTTGEGGMLVTDDDDLAESWRSLVNQGRADTGQWLEHDRLGFNYRLSDVASAIGVAQVEKLPRILGMRAEVAASYDNLFADVPGVTTPYVGSDRRSWFIYPLLLDEGIARDDAIALLAERGIASKPYLPCIHLQTYFRELGFREGMFPVAESISRRTLALPFFAQIAPSDQRRVVEAVAEVVAELGAVA